MGPIMAIPFIGWFLGPLFAVLGCIPFYVLWHWFGVKQFFAFLPPIYTEIGFWNMVGLALIVSMLKGLLLPTFSCTNKTKKD